MDSPSKTGRGLAQESFDEMLRWLDRDRERAGEKYEEIRRQLIKIFVCRGCTVPEDLADETIDRVSRKVPSIAATYVGNPALYFYGVAQMLHKEHLRMKPPMLVPQYADPSPQIEQEYECLDKCIQQLSRSNRDLILAYYHEQKQEKIDNRRALAERLEIGVNALRIRVHRIRGFLENCVGVCVKEQESRETL